MTPIVQIMIAIGMGIIGAIFVTPLAIGYVNNNSNSRKKYSEYLSAPGDLCVICYEKMDSNDMQYFLCGHALHEKCSKDLRANSRQCPTCRAAI